MTKTAPVLSFALLILLAGCANLGGGGGSLFQPSAGETLLKAGIQQYSDGQFETATGNLKSALGQKLSNGDQVQAHKYLAFIACASNKLQLCRDEFRQALAIDPTFTLAAAEVGHPVWGPIFQSEKSRINKK